MSDKDKTPNNPNNPASQDDSDIKFEDYIDAEIIQEGSEKGGLKRGFAHYDLNMNGLSEEEYMRIIERVHHAVCIYFNFLSISAYVLY